MPDIPFCVFGVNTRFKLNLKSEALEMVYY